MVTPVDESFLKELGIYRIPAPVPFLEAGGPVNAYAMEDEGGGFTLFDCAVGTDEGQAAFRAGLEERGLKLSQLNRIVVSHGHVDHFGNAQTLAEETGCEVHVHPGDLEKVCGEGRWWRQLEVGWAYFQSLGVPESVMQAMLDGAKRNRPYARPVDRHRVKLTNDGQVFRLKRFDAKVVHFPGHTPGLTCLHVESHKLLFADDHILARVSPNPLLDLSHGIGETKFKALVCYFASARRAQAMELDCVLPGPGEAFKGHAELLESLFGFYGGRQSRLLKRLEQGPHSVYELVPVVFPRVDLGRMFLMLSEVLGNLEVMEEQGRVKRIVEGGLVKFQRV